MINRVNDRGYDYHDYLTCSPLMPHLPQIQEVSIPAWACVYALVS